MSLAHWHLRRDADGIAWATLDRQGSSTNTLSAEVMAELSQLLDELDREPPCGLVFRSGKSAGFIAGADVDEFSRLDPASARAIVARGWDLYNRLAAVLYPTLALIRGHCLGGGLELALACRYRLVVDEPATRLALPEVMLGIVPGWGGMRRLPRLIGPGAALDMMLTGWSVDAKKAKRLGLADDCVPPRVMDNAARMFVASGRPPRQAAWPQRLLNGPLRGIVAAQARRQVAKRAAPAHYPAPYAILDMWANHGGHALAVPAEAPTSLDALVAYPTTANLVRVFHLQERLKGYGKGEAGWTARHVHVVGAGVMGGDIAAWCALRGLTVTLQDQDIGRVAPAIARAAKLFERRLKDATAVRHALDRLIPDPAGHGVARADVIIEAIFEDLEAKRALFATLETRARPDAVLASNTSSLCLADIAAVLKAPERLVGIHFFNPVARMPLVEVVAGEATATGSARRAAAFVRQIDKLPLPVKDTPGFLVNAVLAPYLREAMRCVDEGLAPEAVDAAAVAFGMPMGPIELADSVGLDIVLAAGRQLTFEGAPPRRLTELVAAGHLGRKTGRGFYAYHEGKLRKSAAAPAPQLAERLVAPLLVATRRLVDAAVVADADLADAGVIFGTGFAPFTGGPMNYLKNKEHP